MPFHVAADPHRQVDMRPWTYRFLGLEIIPSGNSRMDLLARSGGKLHGSGCEYDENEDLGDEGHKLESATR